MAARLSHPCIFRHPMIHDEVNPRLAAINPKAPFGAFQRIWRKVHCESLNRYASADCPYRPEDCVIAYWKTASDALNQAETSPIGLFKILATRRGYDRLENKPLMRDRDEAGRRGRGVPKGQELPRAATGPTRIGDVLRSFNPGARDGRQPQGEEGPG